MTRRWMACLALTAGVIAGVLVPAPPVAAACPAAGGSAINRTPTPSPTSFVFTGGGWGHGVGMSQYGARGAASLGCTAGEILQTYYTGVQVATREPAGSQIRVGLYPYAPTNQTGGSPLAALNLTNQGSAAITWVLDGGSTYSMPAGATWTVQRSGGAFTITQGSTTIANAVPGTALRASLTNRILRIPAKSTRYARGTMELAATATNRFRVTLVVPDIERYLYGLAEMPMNWPQHALRAQAVAGRAYAYIRRGAALKGNCNCHLYDSVFDQAYRGYEPETSPNFPNWKGAVDATAKQVLTHSGNVVTGHYSSSHGGHSESAQFVWGGNIPHQQAVDDSRWELASGNPLTTWNDTRTPSQLGNAVGVGVAQTVTILTTGAAGRVDTIRVVGSTATKTLKGEEFRRLVGLRSSLFTVLQPGSIQSGWTSIVSADLDGDGDDELIFYRASDGRYDVYAGTSTGHPGNRLGSYTIGRGWSSVVAADLDGDGDDELIFYRSSTGAFLVYEGNPAGGLGSRLARLQLNPGWTNVVAADLDGDGDDELIFYRRSDGAVAAYTGRPTGLGQRLRTYHVNPGWTHLVGADLDGDGDDELIFHRQSDGAFVTYTGNPNGGLGSRLSSHKVNPGWTQLVAADLDGDGDDELIFYRRPDGTYRVYAGKPSGALGARLYP